MTENQKQNKNLKIFVDQVENFVINTSECYMFECNNERFRDSFTKFISHYISCIFKNDFKVVCDDTNNTSEVTASNLFRFDMYLYDCEIDEYVEYSCIMSKDGVDFNQVKEI